MLIHNCLFYEYWALSIYVINPGVVSWSMVATVYRYFRMQQCLLFSRPASCSHKYLLVVCFPRHLKQPEFPDWPASVHFLVGRALYSLIYDRVRFNRKEPIRIRQSAPINLSNKNLPQSQYRSENSAAQSEEAPALFEVPTEYPEELRNEVKVSSTEYRVCKIPFIRKIAHFLAVISSRYFLEKLMQFLPESTQVIPHLFVFGGT